MRELVRRGLQALPELIQHLSDKRPTKLNVGKGMSSWFSDEYHSRFRADSKQQKGVNKGKEKGFGSYTLKVGDLCYVACGQILNRGLNAVRYQPTLCLVVNSPVETPELAVAVKNDWLGVTPAEHERSLYRDALDVSNPFSVSNALPRLLYYYPRVGQDLAVKLLNRPFYDKALLSNFIDPQLLRIKTAEERDQKVVAFRKRHGVANDDGLLRELIWAASFNQPERAREAGMAKQLLARHYPGVDPLDPPFVNAADVHTQIDVVEALAVWPSRRFDAATWQLYRRSISLKPNEFDDSYYRDTLAIACASRLFGKGHDAAFRTYFNGCLQECRRERRASRDEQENYWLDLRIQMYRDFLKKFEMRQSEPRKQGTS